MRTIYCLLFLLNVMSRVRSQHHEWFGDVFAEVMTKFSIDSDAIQNNSQCKVANEIYTRNLRNGTYWAARMDDASVKSIGGLLDGDMLHFGHPSQCVRTMVPIHNISGKYCLVTGDIRPVHPIEPDFYAGDFTRDYPPYNTMQHYWEGLRYKKDVLWHSRSNFRWGICIPDTCQTYELLASLNKSLVSACAENNITLTLNVTETDCYTGAEMRDRPVTVGAIVWVAVFKILLCLVLAGSLYEWFLNNEMLSEKKRSPKVESLVLPFSLISNMNRLCSVPEDDKLSILFGIKALSMAILVFGHNLMVRFGNGVTNTVWLEEFFRSISTFLMLNGTIVVDTFFLVSGYLTARFLTDHLRKRGRVNIFLVYLDRIMRVLPSYVSVITFYMYILPIIGQGPRYKEIAVRESNRCLKNWWTNVLYINNFVDPSNMCMLQSWYLTADFQMFVFSIPIIYLIFLKPRLKIPLLGTLLTVSIGLPSLAIYSNNIWGLFPMISDWFADPPSVPYYTGFYIQSYNRYIPYLFGICSFFITDHADKAKWKFSPAMKVFIFFTGLSFILATFLYVSLRFYVNPYEFNLTEQVLFAAIHRIIWSTAWVLFIVINNISGYGILSDIMSLRLWFPLSRLTLTTFMVHIGIMLYTVSQDEQNWFGGVHQFFLNFFGDYLFSTLVALILTMMVEMPFEIFWKRAKNLILGPPAKSSSNSSTVTSTTTNNMSDTKNGITVILSPEVARVDEKKETIGNTVQYTMQL
uniref:Nose resistant to fluoxetine protein 6 n=1 Tax=Cacopsylla melanoneura TaxID=428564 RepID=A0A8D8S2D6_9HEMI